jgi:hypothetical protein
VPTQGQAELTKLIVAFRNFVNAPKNEELMCIGDRGSTVVKVLRYKSEGRWFDPKWCHGINPSDRTMALRSTQPLTEMSTRCISWG